MVHVLLEGTHQVSPKHRRPKPLASCHRQPFPTDFNLPLIYTPGDLYGFDIYQQENRQFSFNPRPYQNDISAAPTRSTVRLPKYSQLIREARAKDKLPWANHSTLSDLFLWLFFFLTADTNPMSKK